MTPTPRPLPNWLWCALLAGLAPLLLSQGRHTRRVTPRLPEPTGPRYGQQGQGPALRVLILGDSAAAGVGVSTQHEALSGCLLQSLLPNYQVQWQLMARTGTTTADALAQLQRQQTRPVDVVLVSLGVNDVTGMVRTRVWLQQQHALLRTLITRWGAQHVLLTQVPPMHAFTALPQPLRAMLGWRAQHLNQCLAQALPAWGLAASQLAVPHLTDLHALASDGFHPGPSTYRAWGQAAAQAIQALCIAPASKP